MADPIFVDLLAALDIVIMERLQDRVVPRPGDDS